MAEPTEARALPVVTLADARAAGLKRYFTGRPCKRGHIAERSATNGTCFNCAGEAAARARHLDPSKNRARARAWYLENTDRAIETVRRYVEANAEKVRANRARYRRENLDLHKKRNAEYFRRNKAAIAIVTKAYRLAHPEAMRGYRTAWLERNPEAKRADTINRRAAAKNAEGVHTAADLRALRARQKERCANVACRASLKKGCHADHIQPLARGGTNWIANIQMLCARCNLTKGAKDPIAWAQEFGRLL